MRAISTHRQRGERVEPGEPGQITDNPGATTGEMRRQSGHAGALAISSDEFSRLAAASI